jgi:hypothetical protein
MAKTTAVWSLKVMLVSVGSHCGEILRDITRYSGKSCPIRDGWLAHPPSRPVIPGPIDNIVSQWIGTFQRGCKAEVDQVRSESELSE